MVRRILALVVVLVMVASVFAGCGSSAQSFENTSIIKIGAIQPISGPVSAYGTQSEDGIKMAIEEINASGLIDGKTFEVLVEDDEATPEKTKTAFTKLVTQDKVLGIIGALTSKCSLAITKDAQDRKIVMISPSSTNDTVTDAGEYVFKACYNDSFQGPTLAKFASETLKAKTAAIMFDNTNDYSVGLKNNFADKFKELGGTVVEASYSTGDKDFSAQLTKLKESSPEVLFISDYYSTVSLMAKQVKSAGITATMIGADGWDEIANNAGDEVVGSYYSNHYAADANDAEVKSFVDKYKEKFGITPNALAALAYDSTYILCEAIARAKSLDPEKIQAEMMNTDKKYTTGNIKFGEDRVPIKPITMVKVVNQDDGKLGVAFAGTVEP